MTILMVPVAGWVKTIGFEKRREKKSAIDSTGPCEHNSPSTCVLQSLYKGFPSTHIWRNSMNHLHENTFKNPPSEHKSPHSIGEFVLRVGCMFLMACPSFYLSRGTYRRRIRACLDFPSLCPSFDPSGEMYCRRIRARLHFSALGSSFPPFTRASSFSALVPSLLFIYLS